MENLVYIYFFINYPMRSESRDRVEWMATWVKTLILYILNVSFVLITARSQKEYVQFSSIVYTFISLSEHLFFFFF